MKKLNTLRMLTLACGVLAITACSKDNPSEGGIDNGNSEKKKNLFL